MKIGSPSDALAKVNGKHAVNGIFPEKLCVMCWPAYLNEVGGCDPCNGDLCSAWYQSVQFLRTPLDALPPPPPPRPSSAAPSYALRTVVTSDVLCAPPPGLPESSTTVTNVAEADGACLKCKLDCLEAKLDSKLDRLEAMLELLDSKLDRVDAKLDSLVEKLIK